MQDPGPKTDERNENGSGMACIENDDPTAANQKRLQQLAMIDTSDMISWNAYPWQKPEPQSAESDAEAARALDEFLALLQCLKVVILNGEVAKRVWDLLAEELNPFVQDGIIRVFRTWHPGDRLITAKDPAFVDRVELDLLDTYQHAGEYLRGPLGIVDYSPPWPMS